MTWRKASRAARYPVARRGRCRSTRRRSARRTAWSMRDGLGRSATVAPATRNAVARRSSRGVEVASGERGGSAARASRRARSASEYWRPQARIAPGGADPAGGLTSSYVRAGRRTIAKDRLTPPGGARRELWQRRAARCGPRASSARYTLSSWIHCDRSSCRMVIACRRSKRLASGEARNRDAAVRPTGQSVRLTGQEVRHTGHLDRPRPAARCRDAVLAVRG